MKCSEKIYICKRRIKAFLSGLVYYVCWIFPVKKNKIVIWTFEGTGGYGCSPKYIAKEILKRKAEGKNNLEIFWLLEDMKKEFPEGIKKVKSTLWARAYHLSTAHFWLANSRTFYGTKKRKGTIYFQTWHGTVSLKPIGKYRGENLSRMAYLVSRYDSKMIDYALSGSRWCTNMWPDGLLYDGEIIETGTPRCDVFFSGVEEKHIALRKEYELPKEAKILLYAPTFRAGSQSTVRNVEVETVSLDFGWLLKAVKKRFGGEWYVFLRLHPQLATKMQKMPVIEENNRLIDVSQRPDMNEIIAACDAMITDYSTAIFEGFLTKIPGFIYADDLDEYVADRGKLMFEMDEIPFPVARNNDELVQKILSFDQDSYEECVGRFIEKIGILEDGHASQRVADLIDILMGESETK